MNHAEIRDLLPLKALDRLEGEEARAVTEHLAAGCDECERELASFKEALAEMAIAEAGDGSSDRVWSHLQSRLGSTWDNTSRPTSTDRANERVIGRDSQRAPARRYRFAMLGSAAALIAIFVSSAFFVSRLRRVTSQTSTEITEIAALTARVMIVQRELDATSDRLAALQTRIDQTTDLTLASIGADARVVHLTGLTAAPSAAGTVALSRVHGAALLQVSGLPPAPQSRVYEVWWIGKKRGPLRAGLFEPSSQHATIVPLDLPPPDEIVLATAITLEPRGGVDQPTGAMYLKGDFSRH